MIQRRSLLTALTSLGASAALASFPERTRASRSGSDAARETIAVLGTGRFGGTIGRRLGALGYQVVYGSRTPDAARVRALVTDSGPISIPYAGADQSSKERVAQLIRELGLDPMDTGPLVAARYIENLLWFEVACNRYNKQYFELYMRHVAV